MKKLGFVALVLLIGLGACEYDSLTKIELQPAEEAVSYSNDISPLFDASCKMCHSGGQDPKLTPADSHNSLVSGGYLDLDVPLESKLMTSAPPA